MYSDTSTASSSRKANARKARSSKSSRAASAGGGASYGHHHHQQQHHQDGHYTTTASAGGHHATTGGGGNATSGHHGNSNSRKWEQKQVQIKTLEGEFSVTMWASGAEEDGRILSSFPVMNSLFYFFPTTDGFDYSDLGDAELDADYAEYMTGRRLSSSSSGGGGTGGVTGVDLSDPKQLAEFAKYEMRIEFIVGIALSCHLMR